MNKRNTNKRLTKPEVNKYGLGDWLKKNSEGVAKEAFAKENLGGTISGLTGGIAEVAQAGIANAQIKDTSAEHAAIDATANTTFGEGSYDNLQEMWDNSLLQGTNYTANAVRGLTNGQKALNTGKGMLSGAATGAKIGGIWGAIGGAAVGLGSGIAGWLTGDAKARREANNLNAEAKLANQQLLANYDLAVQNTEDSMFNKGLLNFASYGGPLYNLSGDFSNGLTFINEGGTHEENPYEGVMVGVDNEGTPNLVEEGEVIFNDYVFSNRLKPTKKLLEDGGFTDKYEDVTFAKIAEDLQKESAERPNDLISMNGLNDMMNRLITMQEQVREKKRTNSYKCGGKVNKFDGLGDNSLLDRYIGSVGKYDAALAGLAFEEAYRKEKEMNDKIKSDFLNKYGTFDNKLNFSNIDLNTKTNPFEVNVPETVDVIEEPIKEDSLSGTKSKSKTNWSSIIDTAMDAGLLLNSMLTPIDHTASNNIRKAARNIPGGSFTPIGNHINIDPIDQNYISNNIRNLGLANARALQNQNASPAALLVNNYNTQKAESEALIAGNKENVARKLQEAEFNTNIDKYNSQGAMQSLAMDQQRAQSILGAETTASQLDETLAQQKGANITELMSALRTNKAERERQNTQLAWMNDLIKSGALRWTDDKFVVKNGGMLTRKRRKK